jgi:hypothetical protein
VLRVAKPQPHKSSAKAAKKPNIIELANSSVISGQTLPSHRGSDTRDLVLFNVKVLDGLDDDLLLELFR